ncbi:ParA family protein [Brevibacterium litoralis]|uniref:ParA family protein n=1 Tax=Brevibacterium litoralis TaxID=3138935 RepID=UPI0032F04055
MVDSQQKLDLGNDDLGPTGRPRTVFPEPPALDGHGPARVIAMVNQKGGVGKTTSTVSLGAALGEFGRKVLLVDFDPQGALTASFGYRPDDLDKTVLDLMFSRRMDPHDVILYDAAPNVDIMPANIELSAAEVQLVNEVAREFALQRVLEKVSDEYDVVLIDCQPTLGLLAINALSASHGAIVPVASEYFALRGVALLIDTIEKVQDRLNSGLQLDGFVATMYDGRTIHAREVIQSIVDGFGDKVFETVIRRTVKFPDASVGGQPITTFAPTHEAAISYRRLARELIARGGAP